MIHGEIWFLSSMFIQLITLGKKGDLPAARRAQGFLLKPTLIPKLFGALAHRYARRPGGYTRIHKFGNRQGDNAPHAVLELVDNPRDLRFNMTARAIGWELMGSSLAKGTKNVVESGISDVEGVVRREKSEDNKVGLLRHGLGGRLRRVTQDNLKKVLKFRGESGVKQLSEQARQYIVSGGSVERPCLSHCSFPGSTRRRTDCSCGRAEIRRRGRKAGRTDF